MMGDINFPPSSSQFYKLHAQLSSTSISYYMASSLEKRLREAEEYARTVEDNFNNNLQVIEEQEQQINDLHQRLLEYEQQNQSFRQNIEQLQEERELAARIAKNQHAIKQEQHEKEIQEVAALIEAKYRRELEAVSQRTNQQLRVARTQLVQRDESSRRVLQENSRLVEVINDLKEKQLDLEQQVTSLIDEKKAMSSKMALHQQQLEGIRVCNSNWEEALKQKIKDAHDERQKLEEQFAQYKLAAKEKLRRQKEDLVRSISKFTEESEKKCREGMFQQKQLQFNLEKVQGELREKSKQVQLLREQKRKMESTLDKYDEHERAFNWNQKQRNQLQQMLEQQKKDAKLQVDTLKQELKKTQELSQSANKKREDAEKAVERLKVELLNRAKENDQLKKTVARLQHRVREHHKAIQPQVQPQTVNSYKPYDRNYDSKGFDIVQSVPLDQQYSKVFTDDVGVVDSKFFDQAKSPKHNISSPKAQRIINRQAQLMKQISQLQLELQDNKSLSKRYLEQVESLRRTMDDRNRELSLIKDKVNLYWQKANDKEQQANSLKEINSELKTSYNQITQELKKYREFEAQSRAKQQELHSIKEKVVRLEKQMREMEEQIDIITKDRDLMEQISSDLRADNHTLREILAGNYEPQQNPSINKSYQQFNKSQQDIRHPDPKEQETVPIYQPERQRFPKKLHDLVREKKMFSISGKRAPIQERATQARLEQIHVGTDSQKQVLQRIKQRNKTPPKIANYAQMKKQKERRSQQLQTVSQKQAYQRLKSRQNMQNQTQSPEKGVNYLRLREMGAQ